MKHNGHILRVDCRDKPGIVAAVAQCLAENDYTIEDAAQFNDHLSGHFFMRTVFRAAKPGVSASGFEEAFSDVAARFEMSWSLHPVNEAVPAVLLVSKADHCLHDILYRVKSGILKLDIKAVISNHEDMRWLAEMHGLDYVHIPVTKETKADAEAALEAELEARGVELVVLARYMQIMSAEFCARHHGRAINIHHSFLPGFKGAKPYHQAHARGVKLIGATAHFVTQDLDEGPIIEQETQRIDHRADPQKMLQIGKDIEAIVLARALSFYAERRIFLHGHHTVIL